MLSFVESHNVVQPKVQDDVILGKGKETFRSLSKSLSPPLICVVLTFRCRSGLNCASQWSSGYW